MMVKAEDVEEAVAAVAEILAWMPLANFEYEKLSEHLDVPDIQNMFFNEAVRQVESGFFTPEEAVAFGFVVGVIAERKTQGREEPE